MSTRINKIRITVAIFDSSNIFKHNEYRHFVTPFGAAAAINNFSRSDDLRLFKQKLKRVEVGNSNGWVQYEIEPHWSVSRLNDAIINAMELQLAFYDDGNVEMAEKAEKVA